MCCKRVKGPDDVLYLLDEFLRLCVALLAVDGDGVHLQLADLLRQLLQRQVRVQALVAQVPVRLQAGSQRFNQSLQLRETIAGQIQLQKKKQQTKKKGLINTHRLNKKTRSY